MLDSGCINHMTGEKSMFLSFEEDGGPHENIIFGDDRKGEVIGLGKSLSYISNDHSISNILLVNILVIICYPCHNFVR